MWFQVIFLIGFSTKIYDNLNREGDWLKLKYGYTGQTPKKREQGGDYCKKNVTFLGIYPIEVNSKKVAEDFEDHIAMFISSDSSGNLFLEKGKKEWFYCKREYFKEFQRKIFPNLISTIGSKLEK